MSRGPAGLGCTCVWALLILGATGCAPSKPTQIIVVRHAEKVIEPGNDDPDLTPAGVARAKALAELLQGTPIRAIYTTHWKRNRQTAADAAGVLGLTPTVDDQPPEKLARKVIARHDGQTVLIVGHSNTVPEWIRAFGCPDDVVIGDQDYDDLFRVMIEPGGEATLRREKYGQPMGVATE